MRCHIQNNPGKKRDSSGTNVMNSSAKHSPAIKGNAGRGKYVDMIFSRCSRLHKFLEFGRAEVPVGVGS